MDLIFRCPTAIEMCYREQTYCNWIVVGCLMWIFVSLLVALFCLDNKNTKSLLEVEIVNPFPVQPDPIHIPARFSPSTTYTKAQPESRIKIKALDSAELLYRSYRKGNGILHGEMGKPVVIPAELQAKAKTTFKMNQFNMVASDLISLNRNLTDFRANECLSIQYPHDLPDVSFIIVFHNEAWSTLIRTLHSIINRSPLRLIKEIILVDDESTFDYLQRPLEDYVALLPVDVVVLRTGNRVGLTKSRLQGTAIARGKVLLFLDSHCECSSGWLEPLLYEIYKNRTTVSWPMIAKIDPDTFAVSPRNRLDNGGFDWRLQYIWEKMAEPVKEKPVKSAAFSGGLFAIEREYFYELGAYDKEMKIWGFENVELSLRIWTCGGQILLVPCSVVAHVFRESTPYTWPSGIMEIITHNSQRVAHVWLDDYADLFHRFSPDIKGNPFGDITERKHLRQRLQCKSFQWYIENVYQTLLPLSPLEGQIYGEVRNTATSKCIDLPEELLRRSYKVQINTCHPPNSINFNPRFVYTTKKQLINFLNICVDWVDGTLMYVKCETGAGTWNYSNKTLEFRYSTRPDHCLDARSNSKHVTNQPSVVPCDGSKYQRWVIEDVKVARF